MPKMSRAIHIGRGLTLAALLLLVALVAACSADATVPATPDATVDAPVAVDTMADQFVNADLFVWPDSLAPDSTPVDQGPAPDLPPKPDTGPPTPATVGCADGTREGFLDMIKAPKIAACGGAWTVPGAHNTTPACNRQAGNTGKKPAGTGCNVSDLCAAGWHVCYGKVDVLSRNAEGCLRIMDGAKSPAFFLARTSSTGAFNCSQDSTKFGHSGTINDLFGCGDLGCKMVQGDCTTGTAKCNPLADCATCAPGDKCLNKSVCKPAVCYPLTIASHDLCKGLRNDKSCGDWCNHLGKYPKLKNAWSCGTGSTVEANHVVKSLPNEQGGVLCCTD